MGNVKVKVRISHLARGTVKGIEENTQIFKKDQEFICSEEEARGLGTSVVVIEKIIEATTEPAKETATPAKATATATPTAKK